MEAGWFFNNVQDNIPFLLALIPVIVIHELAHAVIALMLGDTTAKDDGRITLNPLVHLDVIGTLMILFAGIGWAKPVMVNPHNLRYGKFGMALVAFAGPLSNLILAYFFAVVTAVIINVAGYDNIMVDYFFNVIFITLMLGVLNMIPIPPLDGSKIIALALPAGAYNRWVNGGWWSFIIIIALLYLGVIGRLLVPIALWLYDNLIWPVFVLLV